MQDEKNVIEVKDLEKVFEFSVKDESKSFFANLFSPTKKKVVAVNKINFSVKIGERIAFIGPNGAGKSTTIKMLTGILFSTNGKVKVLGLNPETDRKKLAYKIGTVFGQRSQMFPNLSIIDSMYFFGKMYDLEEDKIAERLKYLVQVFDLENFKNQPVRKLSLGQRMRGEIACALVHSPEIIFLDEPTIGLDVIAKKSLRELLLKINKEENVTIFLTSHDVGDIEALCERTIIVNRGEIVIDAKTEEIQKNFIHEKYVDVFLSKKITNLPELPNGINYKNTEKAKESEKIKLIINLKVLNIREALQKVLEIFEVIDIEVYDVELEEVIREMYAKTK
jgi:ABC-2 type transport system ATP-binding protein